MRAYSLMAEHRFCKAETAVRFCLGPLESIAIYEYLCEKGNKKYSLSYLKTTWLS